MGQIHVTSAPLSITRPCVLPVEYNDNKGWIIDYYLGILNDSIINSIIFSLEEDFKFGVSKIIIGWSSGTIYNILYNKWWMIFSISSQLWTSPSIIGHYGSN